jgi:hypothetical protein
MCQYRTEDGVCLFFSDKIIKTYCVDGPCPYEKIKAENSRREKVKKKISFLTLALFLYWFSLITFGIFKEDLIYTISGYAGLIVEVICYCTELILAAVREAKEDTEDNHGE